MYEEFDQEPEIHREEPLNKGCEGGGGDAGVYEAVGLELDGALSSPRL